MIQASLKFCINSRLEAETKFDSGMAYCFLVENVNQKSFAKIGFFPFCCVYFFFLRKEKFCS